MKHRVIVLAFALFGGSLLMEGCSSVYTGEWCSDSIRNSYDPCGGECR